MADHYRAPGWFTKHVFNPVRNIRVSGGGRLRHGRRVREITVTEVPDDAKPPVLRAYLKRWAWEVGVFFDGVSADSSDEQLRAAAPDHPVFRLGGGAAVS